MIHTEKLTKTFWRKKEKIEAVKAVDIDVAEGELVAFLGPNGAGKSTTLRMLTSLLTPTSGRAIVAGYDVATDPTKVRAQLGYIGQGNGAGHSHRVGDELHNQGRFFHLPSTEYRRRAAELLDALELTGLDKRRVQTLSGGQRRRLDVAMGLMNRPRLLFLDEPSTGLDPHARANLWEHITKMRNAYGMTMVLTTHYLDEADSTAERVIIIDHGEVIADSTPAALKRDHAGDVITLTFAPDTDPGAARSAVETLTNYSRIETGRSASGAPTLALGLEHGPETAPAILFALRDARIAVHSTAIKEATLDDVFLNLTGRSLREEAA